MRRLPPKVFFNTLILLNLCFPANLNLSFKLLWIDTFRVVRRFETVRIRMKRLNLYLVCLFTILLTATHSMAQLRQLKYAPSPPDNPLRGLVPYQGELRSVFPHSLEFNYLPLSDLMKGPNDFDWSPLESLLDDVASRGHQTIFRVWVEFPGEPIGIPQYLIDDGLKVTEWLNENTAPFPAKKEWTPDYEDPRMRLAFQNFIAALGEKYDGDPRVGYITAGLLGSWGEWHTYPRTELFASKEVQTEVLDAFVNAFQSTPILLRYPAGPDQYFQADNSQAPVGYHDDSFAWATLETGAKDDGWFFMAAMRQGGCEDKWKSHPIGGEIRPELWGEIFDNQSNGSDTKGQDFSECLEQTHATWLMDSGIFNLEIQTPETKQVAIRKIQKMGYEFFASSFSVSALENNQVRILVNVRNMGVAPFYHDWRLEVGRWKNGIVEKTWPTEQTMQQILPGETKTLIFDVDGKVEDDFLLRVVNPLSGGLPLRFANENQDRDAKGWLSLSD